jgi:2'-5' RNA ligase
MGEQKRVFIAIDISDEARQRIAAYIGEMKRLSGGVPVKWERPEKLHLTLKFLGSTEPERVAELDRIAGEIAARVDKFRINIAGTGVFPGPANPRILWLGVEAEPLVTIAADVESGCERIGFAREIRAFTPHLTIARIREPARGKGLAASHLANGFAPVSFNATHVTVYESQLLRTGSVYSVIARHPFKR